MVELEKVKRMILKFQRCYLGISGKDLNVRENDNEDIKCLVDTELHRTTQ